MKPYFAHVVACPKLSADVAEHRQQRLGGPRAAVRTVNRRRAHELVDPGRMDPFGECVERQEKLPGPDLQVVREPIQNICKFKLRDRDAFLQLEFEFRLEQEPIRSLEEKNGRHERGKVVRRRVLGEDGSKARTSVTAHQKRVPRRDGLFCVRRRFRRLRHTVGSREQQQNGERHDRPE